MSASVLPFRARRADTRALALVRESVKADLAAYAVEKEEGMKEPLALRAALGAVRLVLGMAWAVVFVIAAVIFGVAIATSFAISGKWDGKYPNMRVK